MTLSISAAAKQFKKSRNTIRDHLKSGVLSYASDGSTIEFSELLRVYGSVPTSTDKSVVSVPTDHSEPVSLKDVEIAVMREKINGLEALLEEREKRILLLTNTEKSWLRKLFNR